MNLQMRAGRVAALLGRIAIDHEIDHVGADLEVIQERAPSALAP